MTWPWSRPARQAPAYVDTPAGLLSADGTHYRTTEPLLREYAGPVVEAVGLGTLLQRAGVWLRSPQTITTLLLPVLLLMPVVLPMPVLLLLPPRPPPPPSRCSSMRCGAPPRLASWPPASSVR